MFIVLRNICIKSVGVIVIMLWCYKCSILLIIVMVEIYYFVIFYLNSKWNRVNISLAFNFNFNFFGRWNLFFLVVFL